MKTIHATALISTLTVTALASISSVVIAADDELAGLEEIIVTATRFATNVQDVPIAVSAISGDSLREAGIVDPRQLSSLAPGLVVDQGSGIGQMHASIRGLASTDFGLGAQSPVAIYLDDVYQPFEYGLGTQVFDLDRIEVLRGPQSTLFGKNTTGGGIAYYSKTPAKVDEGYLLLDAGGGTYNHVAGEGAFNKAITDTLAARLSFRIGGNDKYVTNLPSGRKRGDNQNYNVRLQFAWRPTDGTDVNLKLYQLHSIGDSPAYVGKFTADPCASVLYGAYYCSGPTLAQESIDSRHVYGFVPTTFEAFSNYGSTLKIEQALGVLQLTSITNGQWNKYRLATDDNGVAADAFHSRLHSKTRQVSEELRLATPQTNPLRAVFGVFGMYDRIEMGAGGGSTHDPLNVAPYFFSSDAIQKTTSWAAFSNLTYDITPQFGLVGGLRYTSETKEIRDQFLFRPTAPPSDEYFDHYELALADFGPSDEVDLAKKTWRKFTWELTANFKPGDDQLLYTKIATGFRSGGFPIGLTAGGTFSELDPERVTSYEVGYKSEWLNRRLRFNGDVYYADYKDMQVQVTSPANAFALIRQNAAAAKIQGVELELESAITDALKLKFSAGYSDAKYRKYETPVGGVLTSLQGRYLPFAPKFTGNIDLSYEIPVGADSLTLGTTWNYRSKIYFDPPNFQENMDPGRVTGDVQATYKWANKVWSLTAYVDNVTNRYIKGFGYFLADPPGQPNVFLSAATYNPGRLWGLRLNWQY